MSDEIRRSAMSDTEMKLMLSIRDSGVINFDQLGKVVAQVAPAVFDPGVVADDYIASAYTSVLQIWKTGSAPGLENTENLRSIVGEVRG